MRRMGVGMGLMRRTLTERDAGLPLYNDSERSDRPIAGRRSSPRRSRLARMLPKQRVSDLSELPESDPQPAPTDDNLIYLEALRIRGLITEPEYVERRALMMRRGHAAY